MNEKVPEPEPGAATLPSYLLGVRKVVILLSVTTATTTASLLVPVARALGLDHAKRHGRGGGHIIGWWRRRQKTAGLPCILG